MDVIDVDGLPDIDAWESPAEERERIIGMLPEYSDVPIHNSNLWKEIANSPRVRSGV